MRLALVIAGAALVALGCRGERSEEVRGEERDSTLQELGKELPSISAGRDDRQVKEPVQTQEPNVPNTSPDGGAAVPGTDTSNPEGQNAQGQGRQDPRMNPKDPASQKENVPGVEGGKIKTQETPTKQERPRDSNPR